MLFSQLATYLAFFSVTYLATSLKLAKFSVTERTADLMSMKTFWSKPSAKKVDKNHMRGG